ncbi:uncharacterized protein LOC144139180 [Haemaphysalis longicornis]
MKFTVVIAALAFVIQGSLAVNGRGTEPPLLNDVLPPGIWPRPWEHRSWEEFWRRRWPEYVPLPVQRLLGYKGRDADVLRDWQRNGRLQGVIPPIAFPPWAVRPRI